MPYYVNGQEFMSSALAKAASPGGYSITTTYPGGVNPYYKGTSAVSPAASKAMQNAIAYYQEGGGYGKGVEAQLERGRVKALASGMQSLVSAGLGGTSLGAGLGKKYEEEVAAPMRAQVESQRAQAISGLEMAKAQIIQGATEADRSRALQEYLALLQSQSSYRPTVSQPIVQPQSVTQQPTVQQSVTQPVANKTEEPYKDVPYSQSLVSTAYKPSKYANMSWQEMIASGGVTLQEGKQPSLESLYQGGWTG